MSFDWSDDDIAAAELADELHAEWIKKWCPTCPDRRPQVPRRCLGYRERGPGRLQLRVALTGDEGVCDVAFEEDEDAVRVRLILCYDEGLHEDVSKREYINCPVHIYLEQPLSGRSVIDVETDEPVPLFIPDW